MKGERSPDRGIRKPCSLQRILPRESGAALRQPNFKEKATETSCHDFLGSHLRCKYSALHSYLCSVDLEVGIQTVEGHGCCADVRDSISNEVPNWQGTYYSACRSCRPFDVEDIPPRW